MFDFAPPGCILRHLTERQGGRGGMHVSNLKFKNPFLVLPNEKKAIKAEL